MSDKPDGLRLTLTWEFVGKASVERVLAFVEKWTADALEIDATELRPTTVRSVNLYLAADAKQGTTPGDQIRNRRLALGLNQGALADLAGLTQVTVSNAELDRIGDESEALPAILCALDAAEAGR